MTQCRILILSMLLSWVQSLVAFPPWYSSLLMLPRHVCRIFQDTGKFHHLQYLNFIRLIYHCSCSSSAQQTYLQVVSTVYRTEGVKGFWNGLSPVIHREWITLDFNYFYFLFKALYFKYVQLTKLHNPQLSPTRGECWGIKFVCNSLTGVI